MSTVAPHAGQLNRSPVRSDHGGDNLLEDLETHFAAIQAVSTFEQAQVSGSKFPAS
jgi:hypothetical protein